MMTIIAAMTQNGLIGNKGQLPWHIPEEYAHFKQTTAGNTVIMGRKTYESIPKKFRPLPNRHNIVISRSMKPQQGIDVCHSIQEAIVKAHEYRTEVFCIGGSQLYAQTIPLASKMILSTIKGEFTGDTYFPEFSLKVWEVIHTQEYKQFIVTEYWRKK